MTYLNWKERKTDSAAKPSKANDLKIFLINFFKILFPRSHVKFWPQLASKYVSFTLLAMCDLMLRNGKMKPYSYGLLARFDKSSATLLAYHPF